MKHDILEYVVFWRVRDHMKSTLLNRLTDRKSKDLRILGDFIRVYCHGQHGGAPKHPFKLEDHDSSELLGGGDVLLCTECTKLMQHGTAKLLMCPYDPKPKCKNCETHCYAPRYRERIRKVMRYSGIHFMKRGRLDMLYHYFF